MSDDSGKGPEIGSDLEPIVVDSPVHGEIAEWNPVTPAAYAERAHAKEAAAARLRVISAPEPEDQSPPPPELAAGEG